VRVEVLRELVDVEPDLLRQITNFSRESCCWFSKSLWCISMNFPWAAAAIAASAAASRSGASRGGASCRHADVVGIVLRDLIDGREDRVQNGHW
jgi:hypothetical protein